nr:hypothetical protein [Tanacetum cinerariifolium]
MSLIFALWSKLLIVRPIFVGDKKNIDSIDDSSRVIHCLSVVNCTPSLHNPKQGWSRLSLFEVMLLMFLHAQKRLPYQRLFHHPLVEIISLSFPIFCFGMSYLYYLAQLLPLVISFVALFIRARLASRLPSPSVFRCVKLHNIAYLVLVYSGVNASWSNVFVNTTILAAEDACLPASTLDEGGFYLFSLKDFPFVLVIDLLYFPLDVVQDALAQGADGLGLMKNEDHQVHGNEKKLEEDASDCTKVDDDGVKFSPKGGDYFPTMGVTHRTNVCRPHLRITQMKDKVVPNTSQVKFKKTEVEDHHRISSISNKTKSVTVCNDSFKSRTLIVNVVCDTCGKYVFNSIHDACVSKFLIDVNARTKNPKVVPISTEKPKDQANKSVATPPKKTVV